MSIARAGQGDVFSWLARVEARPGMYVGASKDPLGTLETMLHGYYGALQNHGIVEPVPQMDHHFLIWLSFTTGWSTSAGWAVALREHPRGKDRLAQFFRLVAEYRRLEPVLRFTATRRARPPGAPTRIDIMRYAPTQLHFFRLWHGRRAHDDWIVMDARGNHQTSLTFAKRALGAKFPAFRPRR